MHHTAEQYMLAEVCQMILRVSQAVGLERGPALAFAGLTEQDIAERDAYLPLPNYLRLANLVLARLPPMNMTLGLPHVIAPGSLGVLGQVVSSCATVGGALDAFVRFHRLISNAIVLRVSREPTSVRLIIEMAPDLELLRHPVEAILVTWVTLARQITDTAWAPTRVGFRHAPIGPPEEHAAFFGAPVAFEQPATVMEIAPDALAVPIRSARPHRHAMFTTQAETILAELGTGETTRKVSDCVAVALQSGPVYQADIGRLLGMSARTLSRRLQQEGTSFGAVVDGVRRALSMSYLARPERAVYEVAFLVGYGEPSTFYRNFRRWTGETPYEFRRRLLNQHRGRASGG